RRHVVRNVHLDMKASVDGPGRFVSGDTQRDDWVWKRPELGCDLMIPTDLNLQRLRVWPVKRKFRLNSTDRISPAQQDLECNELVARGLQRDRATLGVP